eukprot:2132050-Alexandrium_andersonii.AAC.1
MRDKKGPEGQALRIRVVTKDLVTFRNRWGITKEVELMIQSIKRPSDSDVQKLTNGILDGHD